MFVLCRLSIFSVGAFFFTVCAWAHHSHQNYIRAEYVQFEGTVREVHWMNPHSWVYLEVEGNGGESAVWALEGAGATTLRRIRMARGQRSSGRQNIRAVSSTQGRL